LWDMLAMLAVLGRPHSRTYRHISTLLSRGQVQTLAAGRHAGIEPTSATEVATFLPPLSVCAFSNIQDVVASSKSLAQDTVETAQG
jgi:hypothetical protein